MSPVTRSACDTWLRNGSLTTKRRKRASHGNLESAFRFLAAPFTEAGATNCEFVEGDAYELTTLAGRLVDFVFMANAFHGVPDQPRLAQAVHKTLKSGGRFAVVNWRQRPREETRILGEPRGPKTELRMSPGQTMESVEAGGLTFAELVELPPYHYAVIFERSSL